MKKLQNLHSRVSAIEKEKTDLLRERNDLQKELTEEKTKNTKVNQDFEELQKTMTAQETVINDLKQSNAQVNLNRSQYNDRFSSVFNLIKLLR